MHNAILLFFVTKYKFLPPPCTTSSTAYNDPAMVQSPQLFSLQFSDQFISAVLLLLSNKHNYTD